jgi:hypothetical protein
LPRLLRLVIPNGDQDKAGADDDTDREENGEHLVSLSVRPSVSQPDA